MTEAERSCVDTAEREVIGLRMVGAPMEKQLQSCCFGHMVHIYMLPEDTQPRRPVHIYQVATESLLCLEVAAS